MTKRQIRQPIPEVKKEGEFQEEILEVNRISRTVKGGRRLRFRVLVALGDRQGRIGLGLAKANEVAVAIQKANRGARKHLLTLKLTPEKSLPNALTARYGGAQILLRPGKKGSQTIKAGSVVRTILHLAGIRGVSVKILGTANKVNNARALFQALAEYRVKEEVKNNETAPAN